ncbi:hypothetical protein NHF40_09900 [Maricaulaceae bacterium EIL42A08]|nr:hypothetical protein [Maricaulaceae bacterium EIL42A08]
MRADPLFYAAIGVCGLALVAASMPSDWINGRGPSAAAPGTPPETVLASTDWIAPFAARLEPQAASTRPPDPVREPIDDWRLVGLVESNDGSFATLASGGQVRTLKLGDTLGGFDLVAIEAGRAVFRRGPEERSLRLAR